MKFRLIAGLVSAIAAATAHAQDGRAVTAGADGASRDGAQLAYREPAQPDTAYQTRTYLMGARLLGQVSSEVEGSLDASLERDLTFDVPADSPRELQLVSNN